MESRPRSALFRGRLRDGLRKRHPELFALVPDRVWRRPWVVHSKPVGSGEHALGYLARYIFRVALADSAILHHDERQVVFGYRQGDTGERRTARLDPQEFIRRFLQHVLPAGFRKVRHYGLHHSSKRKVLRLLQAQLAFTRALPLPCTDKPVRLPLAPPVCPTCASPMSPGPLGLPTPLCQPAGLARAPPIA